MIFGSLFRQWPAKAPGQTVLAPPADPNAAYIFQPGPPADDGQGVVTVEQLYHLSRKL